MRGRPKKQKAEYVIPHLYQKSKIIKQIRKKKKKHKTIQSRNFHLDFFSRFVSFLHSPPFFLCFRTFSLSLSLGQNHERLQARRWHDPSSQHSPPSPQNLRHQILLRSLFILILLFSSASPKIRTNLRSIFKCRFATSLP